MPFFKSQPLDLVNSEMMHTCNVCEKDIDLRLKDCTPFRGNWVHIICWKKII